MSIQVAWDVTLSSKFPELALCLGHAKNVNNEKSNERIKRIEKNVLEEARALHSIEVLKENPIVRAYRDFYWKLGIDPTKTRPSGEALLRRVLHGGTLPSISVAVDAYNLASTKTIIPISGFDTDLLSTPLRVRFAENGETFTGIGMEKPMSLTDKMLVVADKKQILSIYPYRDSDLTKITIDTRNVTLIAYGSQGIGETQLEEAVRIALSYIKLASEGDVETTRALYLRQ